MWIDRDPLNGAKDLAVEKQSHYRFLKISENQKKIDTEGQKTL